MSIEPRPADLVAFGRMIREARLAARRARGSTGRKAGLTLDDLAARTGISKPYLSNIETARAPGPPSEEKLRVLARALNLSSGELLAAADWLRTPASVRRLLEKGVGSGRATEGAGAAAADDGGGAGGAGAGAAGILAGADDPPRRADGTIDLDQLVGRGGGADAGAAGSAGRAAGGRGKRPHALTYNDAIAIQSIPLINRVAAGKAGEFGDLSYPAGVADAYIPAPDLPEAPAAALFAVRVTGDSMAPEYREGDILIVGPAEPRDGDDCVVRLGAAEDYATTFKRVFFERAEGASADAATEAAGAASEVPGAASAAPVAVRLVPLNPAHAPRRVLLEEVTGIYPLMYRLIPRRAAKPSAVSGTAVKASDKLRA